MPTVGAMSTLVLHQPRPAVPERAPYNTLAAVAVAVALSFVTLIGGIVCGHVALSQIRRSGERGRWLAVIALVVGYAVIAAGAALVIAVPAAALLLHVTS